MQAIESWRPPRFVRVLEDRPGMRSWVSTLLVSAASGCLQATPFDADPEQRALNASNMRALQHVSVDIPRFVAIGDSHAAYDDLARTLARIASRDDIHFVAHLGDFGDVGLLKEFEWTQEALERAEKPTFVVLGNHDSLSSGRAIYRQLYGPYDFSFDWGGVKWIFFNSNTLDFDDAVPNRDWLRRELADRAPSQAAVLVTHRPPESAENGAAAAFYQDLLAHHDVALWVHGHGREFRYRTLNGTPVLQCSSFADAKTYAVVTLGDTLVVERCRDDACEPVSLSGGD